MNEDDTFEVLRKPPTEDEIAFGRGKWIYCNQHRRPHTTGWCTVGVRDKTALDATNEREAYAKCDVLGLKIYQG